METSLVSWRLTNDEKNEESWTIKEGEWETAEKIIWDTWEPSQVHFDVLIAKNWAKQQRTLVLPL